MKHNLVICLYVVLIGIAISACVTKQGMQQDYVLDNPGLSDREKAAILTGKIYVGMSASSVRASWNPPYEVIQGTAAYGNSQTWYYKYFYQYWRTKAIVYFIQDDDGVYRVFDITQLAH